MLLVVKRLCFCKRVIDNSIIVKLEIKLFKANIFLLLGIRKNKILGEVAEWFKAHAWKACIWEAVSRVRIPFSPP